MGNTSDGTFTTFEIPDSFGEKWRRMFTSAAEVFDFDLSTLSILYEDRVHILAQGGTVDDLTNRVIDYDFIKCIIERNQPHAIFDLREDSQWQNSPIVQAGFVSAAGFPLRDDDGTPFGTLCVLRTHPAPYPDSHFKLFESFAHSVEVEINAFRDKAKLHEERERRQTAEHLVENAKDLHSMLFDSSLDMMLIHDETGKILDVNARVLERLGYDTSELIGQSPGIIAAPEYAPKAKMRLEQIFTHGEAFFRTQLITKSSEELAVEVTSQLFKWKGKPAIFSVVRELESRRIPEEELEDHKYMIRVSEKVGNMGHWIIDLIDGNLEWSATQYLLHGVEPGSVDATMDFFLSTVHPDDRQWVQNAVEEAIATKTPREAEFRIVLPDGRIRWIRSQNTFLYRGEKAVKFFGIDQDITEEKALIQELEESREHYKSLIENLGDTTAVLRHAIDGTILYLSPSIEPMFGYKPEEGLGKKVQEVCEYSPESLARIETAIGEMVTSGKTITIEVAFKHRDGSWRWNISHAHPVRNSSDQIECIEVVATDITRRKILELELAENEALLKEAQRVGIIGHWSLVPESGHLEWSDETYRIWGIEPGSIDLNLEYALSSVHREDKSRVAKELQRAIESDIQFTVEFRVTRPDGTIRYVRSRSQRMKRSNGDPARILGVAQDVTEEKALIQELEESREHFKSLIENLGDTTAMFRHALDGTLLYLSPSVEPMFGYKPEEGVGQKLQEAVEFSPESLARIMAGVQEMLATGKTVTIEVSFKHRDGSWRWNISHAHPVINSAGAIECIEVVAEDITRRKELELELAESEALLKEAQSLGKMGHWSLDLSTNRLYWSDELYRIHGYEPGSIDLTHELFLKMIHPDDAGWVAELVQSAAEKQETTKVEFRIVRPDGSIRYVRAINSYLERSESDLHIFGVTQDITEEKELAFDLEESHARYKGILDNLGDKTLVFQYAPDGTLLYLSPSCQYIYGITPEEAVGKHFRDVASLSEEVSSRLEHRNALAAEGDGTYTAELEYSHPDGSKRWVLSHAHGVKDEEGTLIFIEGIAEDVTERKLLEQTLKLNEERLSQALIGAGHGLWDVDLAENTIYMSPSWKAMLGYEDAELPNDLEIPFKLMHPDDVEYASNYLDIEYLSTLEKIDLEYRLQHKRGDYVRVHARGKIIKDERGTPIRLIGTHTNITERKMLETRLRVFERFAEESGQAFGIADLNTKVVYANPPMIELLGAKSLDELVGNSFVPYYSKDFIARLRSEIVPIIEEKGQWISENTFINAQGERIEVLEDFFIIKDENGEPRFYATVVTRIDEIKEKERYLEQAKEDAERANRTKSEFLANMSHELRTPLNAIHGMSHLAMESGVNPRQRYFMESIHAAAESLRDVIGNILDLSKVESGTIEIQNEEFLLEQPLEKALNFVALDAYKKGLSLVYEAERKLPGTVIGDERRVTEVLCNLLNNAVKYTEKGEIYLSVTGQEDSNDDTAVLSFSVTDTGAGIDPAAMDRLFQPFVQVDGSLTRKHAGAGIGLALSKQLVELMGGTIEVESTFGNGTTFTCTIPFMQPKQDHRTIANCIDYKLLTKRVLVISELSTERTALERTLGNIGIEVQSASSTEDAMQAIEGAAFDYWLIDLEWSNTNGFAIAEQLTAQSESDATLILLTPPYWNGTLYERAESAGFSSIIRKPLMYHTIQEGLLEVITKSTSEVRTADHDRFTLYKGMAGSGRILVVEDNSINQEVISEMLERLGFEFDIAENGKVALEHLDRTRYNLILMDIQMPVMDGYKTTKEIRTRHHISSIPIIALTAHALSEDRKRCLDAGMNDYMSKPVEPEELVRALQQWIPEHVPASSVDSLHKELDIDRDSEWIQILVQTGIDAPKALRLICGNAPFYTKMLRKFLQEYVPMPTQMILFVRDENFQDATHLAHTMKNMLGYLGAEHLWNETQDLEKHLKAKDPDSETHIRNYQVMIDSTAREVTKALAELEHETAVAP